MNIILTSVDDALADAWERFCGDLPFVSVHRGSIFDLSCDAVVSPANSYGFMDGGIDMLYSEAFGWGVQGRLQALIQEKHHRELLVGAAEIVETGHSTLPFLITAPTMRVPMILQHSVNPYLAARAVLLLAKHGTFSHGPHLGKPISEFVDSIAFPGLGTGVGRIGPNTCARQVRAAMDAVLLGQEQFPASWVEAQQRHRALYLGVVPGQDLQRE
jgi:O-acetyl-ADP-ribose deacetylase (regulator of RNase III)